MNSEIIYNQMETDFITPSAPDKWHIPDLTNVTQNFKDRSMGTFIESSKEIYSIYTAVFLSKEVLKRLEHADARNCLLVTHHPLEWKIRDHPNIFHQINSKEQQFLIDRGISVYVLHTPLDRNSEYGVANALAEVLGWADLEGLMKKGSDFYALLTDSSSFETIEDVLQHLSNTVRHPVSSYRYGTYNNGIAALYPGGINGVTVLEELKSKQVQLLITGVSRITPNSMELHKVAKRNGITIVGATHYSTEKFALMKLLNYFKRFDLPASFIAETPELYDL